MNESRLEIYVREFQGLPQETEWMEFKKNNADPQKIGETISALSNSAALLGKARAYIVWGIDDVSHQIVGTTFRPRGAKIGNEELENWLLKLLDPRIDFRILESVLEGKPIVLIEVPPAPGKPVRFSGIEYIRVGSYTKKLRDFPEKERTLWKIFDATPFEEGIAADNASAEDTLAWPAHTPQIVLDI